MEPDSGGNIKFIWNQGLISPGAFAALKGYPGGAEAAMKFIASTQNPERQLVMFQMIGHGPANPATDALIPADEARFNPVDPANAAVQVALDMEWDETNYGPVLDEYLKIISGYSGLRSI